MAVPRRSRSARRSRRSAPRTASSSCSSPPSARCCSGLRPQIFVGDSWMTLVGGREIVEHGLPHHDAIGVITAGRTWTDQQWLAQLAFYGADVARRPPRDDAPARRARDDRDGARNRGRPPARCDSPKHAIRRRRLPARRPLVVDVARAGVRAAALRRDARAARLRPRPAAPPDVPRLPAARRVGERARLGRRRCGDRELGRSDRARRARACAAPTRQPCGGAARSWWRRGSASSPPRTGRRSSPTTS